MKNQLTMNDLSVSMTATRCFSTGLTNDSGRWQGLLEDGASQNLSKDVTGWLRYVEQVASEAAYLGLGKLAALARVTHRCLGEIAAGTHNLEKPAAVALRRALSAINQQVQANDCAYQADVRVLIDDLKEVFRLTSIEHVVPLHRPAHTAEANQNSFNRNGVVAAEHSDIEVYRDSYIDALDKCTQEESWIAAQLAALAEDMACGTRSDHPSARLMSVMRGHRFFHRVDRVCMAGRVPGSNQLVVVDASLSERCPENTLRRGYSCFVNPRGSLFKMKPGTLRIFGDSARVLTAFSKEGQPVQRSIALIAEQGLRSGLCIAIGRGDQIQGFLFLNSLEPDLFKDITHGYAPVLSLFGLIATITFDANGFCLDHGMHAMIYGNQLPRHSQRFNPAEFGVYVRQAMRSLAHREIGVQVNTKHATDDFLYLPSLVVSTIAELIDRMEPQSDSSTPLVHLTAECEGPRVNFSIPLTSSGSEDVNRSWYKKIAAIMNLRLRNLPLKVFLEERRMLVSIPYEPVLPGFESLLYSIVH